MEYRIYQIKKDKINVFTADGSTNILEGVVDEKEESQS